MKFLSMLVAVVAAATLALAAGDEGAETQRHILAAGDDSIILARRAFRAVDKADN